MDHHRRVHAGERAPFEQEHLAAATFLGRRPDHGHRETELVDERGQCQPGAHGSRGDDVVPARVADCRQGVVLGTDREMQRPVSERA